MKISCRAGEEEAPGQLHSPGWELPLALCQVPQGHFHLLSTSDERGVGEEGDFSLVGPREAAQLMCDTPHMTESAL